MIHSKTTKAKRVARWQSACRGRDGFAVSPILADPDKKTHGGGVWSDRAAARWRPALTLAV